MTGTILLWVIICIIALLLGRVLVFQAACALVDVQPNVVKSLILPGLFWLGMLGVAYGVLLLLPALAPLLPATLRSYFAAGEGRASSAPSLVALFTILILTAVVITLVSWPIYRGSLPTSTRKGLIIATIEQLLLALLAALITAVVMIVLAIIQVVTMRGG